MCNPRQDRGTLDTPLRNPDGHLNEPAENKFAPL